MGASEWVRAWREVDSVEGEIVRESGPIIRISDLLQVSFQHLFQSLYTALQINADDYKKNVLN